MKTEKLLSDWLSEPLAMQELNCKKSTLYYLRKNKKITSSKVGRKVFYSLSSINQLLNDNKIDAE